MRKSNKKPEHILLIRGHFKLLELNIIPVNISPVWSNLSNVYMKTIYVSFAKAPVGMWFFMLCIVPVQIWGRHCFQCIPW